MPIYLTNITDASNRFFNLHWPANWGASPQWSLPWDLVGEMTNVNRQGVYVLLNNNHEVIYIGVGASFGRGRYEGFGLGARISKKYIRKAPNQQGVPVLQRRYIPSREWENRHLSTIATIGFEGNQAYLAYSLEAFLLAEFLPPFNIVRAARNNNA